MAKTNQTKNIVRKVHDAMDIVDGCNCKLEVLKNTFSHMSMAEPEVSCAFWDGLKGIAEDMIEQLVEAHNILIDDIQRPIERSRVAE